MPSITGGVVLVSSRILMPVDLATVRPTVELPITGTISVGAMPTIESIQYIGTIGQVRDDVIVFGTVISSVSSGILSSVELVSTVGTIVQGKLTASISGGVLTQVSTIVDGKVTSSIIGTVTAQPWESGYVTVNTSATIKGSPGALYGVLVSAAGTLNATVLLLNYGAPTALSTILARIIVGTSEIGGFMLDRGVRFSTLAASLIGTGIIVNVYYG